MAERRRIMLELLKTRRSIRRYKDKEIEEEKIEAILKAGLWLHHPEAAGHGNLLP